MGLSNHVPVLAMYTRTAMSKRKIFSFCLMLCLACAPALFAQRGFVHTSGPEIVDGSGKPLMLRGINLGNWFEPEGYMFHFDNVLTREGQAERKKRFLSIPTGWQRL